jgi:hypothetical protein
MDRQAWSPAKGRCPLRSCWEASVAEFPLSHVRTRHEVGGPLPVEYVDLVAWFYPASGDGEMILSRHREAGEPESEIAEKRYAIKLGPFDADQTVPQMADLWMRAVRRMTGWRNLGPHFDGGSEPDGGD